MNTANNINTEPSNDWNQAQKIAFNEFKKRRRSLPSPPDVDGSINNTPKKPKQYDRRNAVYNRTIKYHKDPVNINDTVVHENIEFHPETNLRNSTMSDRFVSMETSESALDLTEVPCDEFDKNLASTLEMIKKKEDPHSILEKLVSQLSENNKKVQEQISKINSEYSTRCNYLNDQLVKLENSVIKKINYVIEKNDERIQAIELTQKCTNENNILWLSFTDPKEIDDLRIKTKTELIRETKKIFSRMNIQLNNVNRVIIDVFINKIAIRTSNGYENELIMGIKFLNSGVVRDLKRLAFNYAKEQFVAKNYDVIRYTVRDNWSFDIWKLLRICYDLNRFKLLQKTHVSDAGIMAFYEDPKNTSDNDITVKEVHKTLIRTESDLDELRASINDVGLDVPAFQFYNSEYFKLSQEGREKYKQSFVKKTIPQNSTLSSEGTANADNAVGENRESN